MKLLKTGTKALRYGLVGISAAGIHGSVLVGLSQFHPFWISNVCAFLTASLFSYLGHALFTFRDETFGQRFAKRWLLLQFTVNVCISALLPMALSPLPSLTIKAGILMFTPTFVNALIWSRAARYASIRNRKSNNVPSIHADDFGLTEATNKAIISLLESNKLNSTSLIVNGSATNSAIEGWKKNSKFPLYLHLCLTEGPATTLKRNIISLTNKKGLLKQSFINLFFISFLPKKNTRRKRVKEELRKEIYSQIYLFKKLTGLNSIKIDGHQHIHLVPIVLEILLEIAPFENIKWLRTTNEPIPTDIAFKNWYIAISKGGCIKWLILQALSYFAKLRLYKASIKTNSGFSGVIFTGHMSKSILIQAWKELEVLKTSHLKTPPMILLHPGEILSQYENDFALAEFPLSRVFFNSKWRQKELKAIQDFNPNIISSSHESF